MLYACEFTGVAFVLFVGASAVALLWGAGSPLPAIDAPILRRFLTGTMFAAAVLAVVYSPIGQRSGGHLNPAMTVGFWALGRVRGRDVLPYVAAQTAGAFAGVALAAALFPELMRSVQYAATLPGDGYTWRSALPVEIVSTFALAFLVFVCVNTPRVAARTGLIAGAFLVTLFTFEMPVTATSVNPARSLAPAVLFPVLRDAWLYILGPIAGATLAAAAYRARWGASAVCAKLYHTEKYPCPFQCGYRLVRAGEVVMTEGDVGTEAYVLDRGALRVTRQGILLAELGPGSWVGEMSLLLGEPRSATVTALTDAQLRRVTPQSFARLLSEDPARTQELLRQLASRVKEASAQVARGN